MSDQEIYCETTKNEKCWCILKKNQNDKDNRSHPRSWSTRGSVLQKQDRLPFKIKQKVINYEIFQSSITEIDKIDNCT